MRIVLIGQAAFAAAVLKKLLENGEDVIAVYAPADKSGDVVEEATNTGVSANQNEGFSEYRQFYQTENRPCRNGICDTNCTVGDT